MVSQFFYYCFDAIERMKMLADLLVSNFEDLYGKLGIFFILLIENFLITIYKPKWIYLLKSFKIARSYDFMILCMIFNQFFNIHDFIRFKWFKALNIVKLCDLTINITILTTMP